MIEKVRNLYQDKLGTNLMFMSIYGSREYGTSTETSDYDIIMVYEEVNLKDYRDQSYSNVKRESNFSIKDTENFEQEVDIKVISLWSFLEGIVNGYTVFSECLYGTNNYIGEDFKYFYENKDKFAYVNLQGYTRSAKGEFYKAKKHIVNGRSSQTTGSNRPYIDKYGYATKLIQQSYLTHLKMLNIYQGKRGRDVINFNFEQQGYAVALKDGYLTKEEALEFFYIMEEDIIKIRNHYMNTFLEKDKANMEKDLQKYFSGKVRIYI